MILKWCVCVCVCVARAVLLYTTNALAGLWFNPILSSMYDIIIIALFYCGVVYFMIVVGFD